MVDFAGWSMPLLYTSIVAEHRATRGAVGIFDVSHMGRLRFEGPESAQFLDYLLTRQVTDMTVGRIRYALMTDERGGVLDDVLVYCLEPDPLAGDSTLHFRLVVNAGNREKIVEWVGRHIGSFQTSMRDETLRTAMIAVQGPGAVGLIQSHIDHDLSAMKYYTGQRTGMDGISVFISRTGYTGEDGCELIVNSDDAVSIWEDILADGSGVAVPAGLASRDTLRLEAAMPLYGHEISADIDPLQAGLGFAVNMDGRDFIGRNALVDLQHRTEGLRRVGLKLSAKRVPRQGHPILAGGEPIGAVTSGTFSPTLERPIAMGYVATGSCSPGTVVDVEIRGRLEPAEIVTLPFYQRC